MVWTLQSVCSQRSNLPSKPHPANLSHSLAPKYEELAQLYEANADYKSKVTIAKVDATTNDVPDEIAGFPTIKLYPAGKKDAAVDYSGSRTVEDLAKFIAEHGTHKIDAWVEPQEDSGADVTMADDTMVKAAPAATTKTATEGEAPEPTETEPSTGEKIAEAVKNAAEAVMADDAPPEHHDEL